MTKEPEMRLLAAQRDEALAENERLRKAGSYLCTACPVWTGECPRCGTFHYLRNGKRYSIRPTDGSEFTNDGLGCVVNPKTGEPLRIDQYPNVTVLRTADIIATYRRELERAIETRENANTVSVRVEAERDALRAEVEELRARVGEAAPVFLDGSRVTPGTEKCRCDTDGRRCEFPCFQRLGLTSDPCCDDCAPLPAVD